MMNRRNMVGLASVFGAVAASTSMAQSNAAPVAGGVTLLSANDDVATLINQGKRLFMLDPAVTYTWGNISIPSGVTILGNGATVRSSSTAAPVLKVHDAEDVLISGIRFLGISAVQYSSAVISTHIAISAYKTRNLSVDDCDFDGFMGAGVSIYNYFNSGYKPKLHSSNKVNNCRFRECQYGFMNWYLSEYGTLSNCTFAACRVAICSIAGNWVITGNNVVGCRAAFIATQHTNEIAFNTGSNWSHGNVSANTFNHSNDQSPWGASTLQRGSGTWSPVGVVIDTVLPVTFTANALWYTNMSLSNPADDFYVTGCTLQHSDVTVTGGRKVYLTGCWLRSDFSPSSPDVVVRT